MINKYFNFEMLCCFFHGNSWLDCISQHTVMSSHGKGKQCEVGTLWVQQDMEMGVRPI